MVEINKVYINKKTLDFYIVHNIGINCTNRNDGQKMVRYTKIEDTNNENEFYREIKEFSLKFIKKET